MKKRKKKLLSYILITTLVMLVVCSCSKDYTKGTPFEKNKETPTLTPSGTDTEKSDTNDSSKENNTGKKDTDKKNDTTNDSGLNSQDVTLADTQSSKPETTDNSGSTDKTDPDTTDKTGSNNTDNAGSDITDKTDPDITGSTKPEDITPSPTAVPPTESPSSQDSFNRTEYWNNTFLVWLPVFNAGSFSGKDSAGTFDYATFTDVSGDDIREYINELKKSGFTNIGIENYSDSAVSFSASNDQNWEVRISLTGNTLVLGSGFEDKDQSDDDKTEILFSTTMLQYLPHFSGGEYVSSETGSDSTLSASVILTDVSENDVLYYIEKLKESGYIYAPDEGKSDDFLWYIALNEECFECRIEFSGSDLKITCSYENEE